MSQKIEILPTDALLHVDVQTTFMPGGGLAVKDGDGILPAVLALHAHFDLVALQQEHDLHSRIYATLDQHPWGHISLASSYVGVPPYTQLDEKTAWRWTEKKHGIAPHARFDLAELRKYLGQVKAQTLWPDHGIAGTAEADIHPALYAAQGHFDFVLVKGYEPACDSYSGFRDNLKRTTGLADTMREHGVERIFIDGLAFDFCVGWSALDAVAEGFAEVCVIEDATRSVDLPGTVAKMRADLAAAGVRLIRSTDILG
ncbi:MAG: hypothetical protein RL272_585 [Candidatus Parcubacteria bacterium]|jgi:nicotinamidase/pyrazinamidase